MKKSLLLLVCSACLACSPVTSLDRECIADKIKGAWAGQTIGCAYGGPTEFKYPETIPDSVAIKWDGSEIAWYFDNLPGMYDDIYMDLTFLDVLSKMGGNASGRMFAEAFALAEYPLWHANQAARYNIQNGIYPPLSGHWKNNPHADDIDFQIEADFAGIINPGMPQSAAALCDTVGHIMNYGDGWYGGVFISTMYSLAFLSSDIPQIVRDACNVIPEGTKFHNVISDVISFHKDNPTDWRACWQMVEDRYGTDISCPSFLCKSGNIDATVNSAYVAMGLLYGDGDFSRSLEIAARCGNDSDCNPSSVGGILGTVLGYDAIPGQWRNPLEENENREFPYTGLTLKDTYEMSLCLALGNITNSGGSVHKEKVSIRTQKCAAVRFEQSFAELALPERVEIGKPLSELPAISFDGRGIVVRYYFKKGKDIPSDYVAEVDITLDNCSLGRVRLPIKENDRKLELFHTYQLPAGKHSICFEWNSPLIGTDIVISSVIIYK